MCNDIMICIIICQTVHNLRRVGSRGYQERAHWNNYKVTNLGTGAKTQHYIELFPVPARRQEFNSGKRVYSINSLVLLVCLHAFSADKIL